jgi:hypothetical protein
MPATQNPIVGAAHARDPIPPAAPTPPVGAGHARDNNRDAAQLRTSADPLAP